MVEMRRDMGGWASLPGQTSCPPRAHVGSAPLSKYFWVFMGSFGLPSSVETAGGGDLKPRG